MPMNLALPPDLILPLAGFFLVVNVLAFLAFWLDKRLAEGGEWRVSETKLLFLAAIGGFVGAKLAQVIFRHTLRAPAFRRLLNLTVLVAPLVVATPFLITQGPVWIGAQVDAYFASYDNPEKDADKISPLGAAYQKPVAAEAPATEVAALDGAVVDTAGAAPAAAVPEKVLPKRFGPTSGGKKKSFSHKTVSVGGN
jgi:uncharacterized membrane protein YsdA (DUF1294 family)